ncbi:MAG: hypothetical protein DRJ98_08740 [Thermoprotei archaeon]|nr:MAG: hypothetical protein DRJ98_08740 [Thermoprotei archaeon]
MGSYARIPHTRMAEVSLVVRDDWQNKGLGTLLLKYLIEIAKKKGFEGFTAWVLIENTKMMHIFKKLGYPIKYRIEGNLYYVVIKFQEDNS